MPSASVELELAHEVSRYVGDPLGFVLAMYPWGKGALVNHDGPDTWQTEVLTWLGQEVRRRRFDGKTSVAPIRKAVSSGHGVGKSVLVAWLVDWLMSTRANAQGTVTANTAVQLETKTWAAVQRWTPLCLTGHWFIINSARMYHPGFPKSWFCTPQTCKEENSEAFAGQHAADSTSFYINDEDSAVPDKIHEVEEGGLTDGEPMIFLFGNATRSTGAFHTACFGTGRDKWHPTVVDSRTSRFTNKATIAEWEAEYGEDSDFFRVRVRGLPPRASELQFIDHERIWQAQQRPYLTVFNNEPLIAGVDVSGGGAAWNVVRFRRGMDARSIPPIRLPGEVTRNDRSTFLAILAGLLKDSSKDRKIAMMFFDSAFGAPYVERLSTMGFSNVQEVSFGMPSPDDRFLNMRSYMWDQMKEWLRLGAIDPKDARLESDLTGPGYHLNRKNQVVLESKESMQKRNVASPDDADALCLTQPWGSGKLAESSKIPQLQFREREWQDGLRHRPLPAALVSGSLSSSWLLHSREPCEPCKQRRHFPRFPLPTRPRPTRRRAVPLRPASWLEARPATLAGNGDRKRTCAKRGDFWLHGIPYTPCGSARPLNRAR